MGGKTANNVEKIIPKPRIEALSDLIFGLALSIGALTLIATPPTNFGEMLDDMFFFTFSFIILISVWHRYSTIMSVLPVETSTIVALNIILLYCVSIEPYLFNLFQSNSGTLLSTVTMAYALDLGALQGVLGFFTHELTREERRLIPDHLIRKYLQIRNFEFLASIIFFISALPIFGSIVIGRFSLRVYIWGIPIALVLLRQMLVKQT
jgi:uncharacterized membrane protein